MSAYFLKHHRKLKGCFIDEASAFRAIGEMNKQPFHIDKKMVRFERPKNLA